MSVTLRFFAAARAAVGVDELTISLPSTTGMGAAAGGGVAPTTVAALVALVRPAATVDPAEASAVLARCSFLVDGVSTQDTLTPVPDGAVIDVMPPFAGG